VLSSFRRRIVRSAMLKKLPLNPPATSTLPEARQRRRVNLACGGDFFFLAVALRSRWPDRTSSALARTPRSLLLPRDLCRWAATSPVTTRAVRGCRSRSRSRCPDRTVPRCLQADETVTESSRDQHLPEGSASPVCNSRAVVRCGAILQLPVAGRTVALLQKLKPLSPTDTSTTCRRAASVEVCNLPCGGRLPC